MVQASSRNFSFMHANDLNSTLEPESSSNVKQERRNDDDDLQFQLVGTELCENSDIQIVDRPGSEVTRQQRDKV